MRQYQVFDDIRVTTTCPNCKLEHSRRALGYVENNNVFLYNGLMSIELCPDCEKEFSGQE